MIVLLCAVAIGQFQPFGPIEDVAVLRKRYEAAQAAHAKLQASYERLCESVQQSEAQWKDMEALLSDSTKKVGSSSGQRLRELLETEVRHSTVPISATGRNVDN